MAEEDQLLREVNDDLRHDRMVALWRQYRGPLFAAALALVLGTAGNVIWKNYQDKQNGVAMAELSKAQDLYARGKYTEATVSFSALADDRGGAVHDMARLWQARALEKDGKIGEAAKVLAALAEHPKSSDLTWADLACLRLAGIDEAKASCLSNGASPLQGERELVRAASLWKQGKNKDAARLLKKVANDASLPRQSRMKAQSYLTVVSGK